jgi:Fic family protein
LVGSISVKNNYEANQQLLQYNPFLVKDLLSAHRILMGELVQEAGEFRQREVGIFAGDLLVQMAPPVNQVPQLIDALLYWTENSQAHPLIKSCVFYYEFEFIRPFVDGNGRMGRMWQTLLLTKWKPIFARLPVEALIWERQEEYYQAMAASDKMVDSGPVVEFLLQTICDALKKMAETEQTHEQVTVQVRKLLDKLGTETLSAKELMKRVGLKHRPTFRSNYLVPAMKQKLIEMTIPDKPNSSNQKYRKTNLI